MEHVRTEQLLSSPVSGEVSHPMDRGMLGAHCSIGSIFILSILCKKLICVCIGHMTAVNSNCFLFFTIWSRNLMMLRLSGILEEVCKCISWEFMPSSEREGQTCDSFETKSWHQGQVLGWSMWWTVLCWGSVSCVRRTKGKKEDGNGSKSHK